MGRRQPRSPAAGDQCTIPPSLQHGAAAAPPQASQPVLQAGAEQGAAIGAAYTGAGLEDPQPPRQPPNSMNDGRREEEQLLPPMQLQPGAATIPATRATKQNARVIG